MTLHAKLFAAFLCAMGLSCALFGQQPLGSPTADSVSYHPRTKLYFVYVRDSLRAWRLREVLDEEAFLRYREGRLLRRGILPQGEELFPGEGGATDPGKERDRLTLRTTGQASLKISGNVIEDDAPSLPVSMRKRSYTDVLFESDLFLQAAYGDRLKLDVRYNTRSALERDRQTFSLRYEGDRFDPVERIEAGNVSFVSRNPLISAGTDLFGFRGDFRIGRLSLTALGSRRYDMERKILIGEDGSSARPFEWKASEYQFACHFFLLESFARGYDAALSDLPFVRSDLLVDRVEVWVTNDRGIAATPGAVPVSASPSWALTGVRTEDFERLPSATRLSESDYVVSPSLGFISLRTPLSPHQRLAVAFSYTQGGKSFQVGTFVSDGGEVELALLSDDRKVPDDPLWPLMMKNGYPIPYSSSDSFSLQVLYRDPVTGVDLPSDEEGLPWLRRFGLDRSNTLGEGGVADGIVDDLPGILYFPGFGTLFLPSRRPFEAVTYGGKPFSELYD